MELLLGLALSSHLGFQDTYNETHPHLRLEAEKFSIGTYYNSMDRVSFYGGYNHSMNNWFLEGGLVTGYDEVGAVIPYVRAGYDFNNGTSIFFAPAAEVIDDETNVGIVVGVQLMTGVLSTNK